MSFLLNVREVGMIRVFKNSRAGWFTLSHFQGSEDCVTCNEDDEDSNGSGNHDHESGYVVPDYESIFARPEMQPCPGVIGEWEEWSNCDRSCGAGIKIRTRECSDERGPGYCEEDERELALCNTRPCLSTMEQTGQWSGWLEWSDCSGTWLKNFNLLLNYFCLTHLKLHVMAVNGLVNVFAKVSFLYRVMPKMLKQNLVQLYRAQIQVVKL